MVNKIPCTAIIKMMGMIVNASVNMVIYTMTCTIFAAFIVRSSIGFVCKIVVTRTSNNTEEKSAIIIVIRRNIVITKTMLIYIIYASSQIKRSKIQLYTI